MVLFGGSTAITEPVGRSPTALVWSRLRRSPVALFSVGVLALFALVALAAPAIAWLYGDRPDSVHSELISGANGLPYGYAGGISADHWLGLEPGLGRDVLLQLVYGARTSLGIALSATVLSTLIGVTVGVVGGYFGGVVDAVLGWLTDVMLAFPFFLFCLAAIPVLNVLLADAQGIVTVEQRVGTVIGVFAVFGWMSTARLVRGEVLSLREREFVTAARAAGAGPVRILYSELLPNLWGPIVITASIAFPNFVTGEAALSFLGIGVVEPTPDWGRMLDTGLRFISTDPLFAIFPGLVMFVLVLASNLLGDALRDVLDPRSLR